MAWPSWMTSQINGGYQQQYASMGMMQPSGQLAESLAGGLMSRGMGTAGPMAGGVASMMGLDPLSMGMSAASRVWGMGGGVMGAGLAGMGMAGGVAAVGMGVQYAGGQMMQGAQNQMAFNNAMRSNFNFMRQDGTGQGFNRTDLSNISSTLQSMTHSYGPGGETAGFGELSKLAANMGKMGMTTGVRDAQEFSKKFKEMVSTLKTVATELGTSLESAQELLSSARGSGIFKASDQLKFSSTMRNTGLAGGLATSEMTSMANIGSRISRQFGGLGNSGAMGGIKAIGQVGIAQQIGVLSEEDIYNATGATGAEGRQALAADMMQNTGNFLRSGKGRYFLASVAGKDGKLNMDAANEYLYGGGMGTGRTKELAHQNLQGIGRANFIRNEGHLRGAVMEKFGGMAPAMALMGWVNDRGINIDNMDDRSMELAQRQLGIGRDELNDVVKMAQNMPAIMREERNTARHDQYSQKRAQSAKSRDLRTQLEHIRHGVQEKLQEVGSQLFEEGSDMIEETMNRILGQYETYTTAHITEIADNAKNGGAGNLRKFKETFGDQAGIMGMSAKEIGAATARRGGIGGVDANPSFARENARIDQYKTAASYGGSDDATAWAKANQSSVLGAYGMGGIGGMKGQDRINGVAQMLTDAAQKGDTQAQKVLIELQTNPSAAYGVVGSIEQATQSVKEGNRIQDTLKYADGKGAYGGFLSEKQQLDAMGGVMTGQSRTDLLERAGAWGQTKAGVGSVLGMFAGAWTSAVQGMQNIETGSTDDAMAAGDAAEARVTKGFYDSAVDTSEGGKIQQAVGAAFKNDSSRALIRAIATGRSPDEANRRIAELSGKEAPTPQEKGELAALKMVSYGKQYADLSKAGDTEGIKKLLLSAQGDEAVKAAMGNTGISEGSLQNWKEGTGVVLNEQARIDRAKLAGQWSEEASAGLDAMQNKLGLVDRDNKTGKLTLSAKAAKGMSEMSDSSAGVSASKLAIQLLQKQQELAKIEGNSPEADAKRAALMGSIADGYGGKFGLSEQIQTMSIEDKRKFAKTMAGTEAGDIALTAIGDQQKLKGVMGATKGNLGAVGARYLGLNLGKEGEDALGGKSGTEAAAALAAKLGLKGADAEKFQKELATGLDAAKGGANNAGSLIQNAIHGASPEVQEKINRANKEAADPVTAGIEKNTQMANKYLEAIAKKAAQGDQPLIDAINKISNPNPEK